MKKYLKAMSMLFVLSGSVYLPTVSAASSNAMLITIAETSPVLLERLNNIALEDKAQLNNLLKMADSNPEQLERLLNLRESNPVAFEQLTEIVGAEKTIDTGGASVMGIDDGNGIIRN